jgi:hypothetical protein
MNAKAPSNSRDLAEATAWLKDVLLAILDASTLPVTLKKETRGFIHRLPAWYLIRWAEALNIDPVTGYKSCPGLAGQAGSNTGKAIIENYLKSHEALSNINSLRRLASVVISKHHERSLPASQGIIERQVFGLALAGCTSEGGRFSKQAESILNDAEYPSSPLDNYYQTIKNGGTIRINTLEKALAGGRYGSWVAERLIEARRYFSLEPPRFIIRRGKRTPQWEQLWQKILTGGD